MVTKDCKTKDNMCITEKRVTELLEVHLTPISTDMTHLVKSMQGINSGFKELNGTVKASRDRIRDLEESSAHRKENCPYSAAIEGLIKTDLAERAIQIKERADDMKDWAMLDRRTKRQEHRMYVLGLFIAAITVLSNWLLG